MKCYMSLQLNKPMLASNTLAAATIAISGEFCARSEISCWSVPIYDDPSQIEACFLIPFSTNALFGFNVGI